jgi:hypothetical protein
MVVAQHALQQQQSWAQYQSPTQPPPPPPAQYVVVTQQQQAQPWAQYQPHTPSQPTLPPRTGAMPPQGLRAQHLQRTRASSYSHGSSGAGCGAQQQQHAGAYSHHHHQKAATQRFSHTGLRGAGTTTAAVGEERQQSNSNSCRSKVDAPLLTAWLKAATSPEQLLRLVQQHAAALNHIHLGAAYTQAVKVCGCRGAAAQQQGTATVQQQLLSEMHQLAVQLQQQCDARGLANIIWSCGKLSSPVTAQLLLPLFLHTSTLQQAKPQEVANVLWAAATLQLHLSSAELQQLLDRLEAVLSGAKPQDVSNTLWVVATMGQQVPTLQLQQLLGRLEAVLSGAKPQDVSNALWAVATMGQQVRLQQLQPLLDRLEAVLPDSNPQDVSNTLWAVATMGQHVLPAQLQQLLGRLEAVLSGATTQELSNTLWAAATMGQQVPPPQLQLLLAAFQRRLPAATLQGLANLLWACGKMQYLPLQILQSLDQHPQLHQLVAATNPQDLASIAWACGQLGYAVPLLPNSLLQQAAKLLQDGGTGSFSSQGLCNLCWSAAVLDLQQSVPQVLQLVAAVTKLFSTCSDQGLQQLHQVHLWLLDGQLPAPGQGLLGVLTQQQLGQCRATWERTMFATAKQQPSRLQQSVYAAVLQLPPDTWQQQPQSEQPTADKACLIDIAAVTASGVKVAIEVEGPYHYVQPGHTLSGPTFYRNRALAARGYALVSIPHWEWTALHSSEEQQQHLLDKLSRLGGRGRS